MLCLIPRICLSIWWILFRDFSLDLDRNLSYWQLFSLSIQINRLGFKIITLWSDMLTRLTAFSLSNILLLYLLSLWDIFMMSIKGKYFFVVWFLLNWWKREVLVLFPRWIRRYISPLEVFSLNNITSSRFRPLPFTIPPLSMLRNRSSFLRVYLIFF